MFSDKKKYEPPQKKIQATNKNPLGEIDSETKKNIVTISSRYRRAIVLFERQMRKRASCVLDIHIHIHIHIRSIVRPLAMNVFVSHNVRVCRIF